MKIVEYNHSYAQKVAEMWNKSGSNWGNDEIFKTAQDVINTESNNGNIKLYLAVDNDQVVGYCSFSEYQHDEGASYLPLLNVIPEYHGKKVGKELILTVLNEAIKSKWSRFDLYTWSGNIKAMPLYKKCGFFWERKNDTVHLMNFLPYLYQTEALSEYLEVIDTYNDNKRFIDMNQDGNPINGFDFYRYEFKNQNIEMICEFEKTGRGLTYLETPDYQMKMNVIEHDQVYNEYYDVTFDVVNKSDKPLEIKAIGRNNKNIEFILEESTVVEDQYTIYGRYFVGPIEKNQDKARTHPVIEMDVWINNKLVTFKTGIEPKHPVTMKLFTNHYNHVLSKVYTAYIDLENNLSTREEFTIKLPSTFVSFDDEIKTVLNPKEKRSIKVNYQLNNFGFYREEATIYYQDYEIYSLVYSPFNDSRSSFIGQTDYLYFMMSGNYVVYVNTRTNNIALKSDYTGDTLGAFLTPQLGLPYNLEFSTQVPEIELVSDNELKMIYTSKTFDGVQLIRHVKHMYGVLETYYEIINNGDDKTIAITIPVWQKVMDTYIPYKGKLLLVDQEDDADLGSFITEYFDENWFFDKEHSFGLSWEPGLKMKVSEWKLTFDIENIELPKNGHFISPSFYTSYVHKTVNEFREFAGYLDEREEMAYQEILINNGNPFTKSDTVLEVINHKKSPLEGDLVVDGNSTSVNEKISVTPGLKDIKVILKDKDIEYKRMLFKTDGQTSKTIEDDSLVVRNGLLTFKASSKYADSIYSLCFGDLEYLDSNYPTPKERAWWGDFVGGMTQRIQGLQDISSLQEKRNAEFVTVKDNFGNVWDGIKITLEIEKDPDLKGLKMETYTVTLPGTSVVHSFAKITNQTGKLLQNRSFIKFNTLHIDDLKEEVTVRHQNRNYKCNNIGFEFEVDNLIQYQSTREYDLAIYNAKCDLLIETQKLYNIFFSEMKITIPDLESKQIPGDFFIFTKEVLKKEYLMDLNKIKFEV